MEIGLFIPFFMNELYPEACVITLKVLNNLNLDIEQALVIGAHGPKSGCVIFID